MECEILFEDTKCFNKLYKISNEECENNGYIMAEAFDHWLFTAVAEV
jgi:hypothetical protein